MRATGETTGGAFHALRGSPAVGGHADARPCARGRALLRARGPARVRGGRRSAPARPRRSGFRAAWIPHAQRRVVPHEGRLLVMTTPAGLEGFFRALAAAQEAGMLGPEAYAEASERHGLPGSAEQSLSRAREVLKEWARLVGVVSAGAHRLAGGARPVSPPRSDRDRERRSRCVRAAISRLACDPRSADPEAAAGPRSAPSRDRSVPVVLRRHREAHTGRPGATHGAAATGQAGEATMSSPTLKVRTTRFGKVLFAGNGRVVYAFTRDRRNGPAGATAIARRPGQCTLPRGCSRQA